MANNIQCFNRVKQGCAIARRESAVRLIALLIMLLSGCQSSNFNKFTTWKIYHNPRYGFEFPYPSNWVASRMPDNRDGQAFSDPKLSTAEIRGWAGYRLSETQGNNYKLAPQNFTTQQGLSGELQVEVGSSMSMMTLTLNQGSVRYNWQGRSPSAQFANYYRFFYYVAGQYSVPLAPVEK